MVYMGDKVNKQVRYFQINIIGTLSRGAREDGRIGGVVIMQRAG